MNVRRIGLAVAVFLLLGHKPAQSSDDGKKHVQVGGHDFVPVNWAYKYTPNLLTIMGSQEDPCVLLRGRTPHTRGVSLNLFRIPSLAWGTQAVAPQGSGGYPVAPFEKRSVGNRAEITFFAIDDQGNVMFPKIKSTNTDESTGMVWHGMVEVEKLLLGKSYIKGTATGSMGPAKFSYRFVARPCSSSTTE